VTSVLSVDRSQLPAEIAALTDGYAFEQITLGRSGNAVYRLSAPGRPTLFLKAGAGEQRAALADEAARLRWLAGRLPAPELVAEVERGGGVFLLMTAVPGVDCSDRSHAADVPAMVRLLAEGLRLIHAAPLDDCPFDHTPRAELERARRRLELGLVDAGAFDADPAEVFEELLRLEPREPDIVLTHGDYCLPNVLIDGGRLSGFCDLGRLGAGDRYRDLALAARSLAYNWGAEHVPLLFEAYGLPQPDQRRLEFFRLLDEFC